MSEMLATTLEQYLNTEYPTYLWRVSLQDEGQINIHIGRQDVAWDQSYPMADILQYGWDAVAQVLSVNFEREIFGGRYARLN